MESKISKIDIDPCIAVSNCKPVPVVDSVKMLGYAT